MSEQIPLFEIPWDESDIKNVTESISRGSYWAKGPFVDQFESGLESYLSTSHATSVNSGTTALVAALKACGIGHGDEVIVPSFTFIATANVVKLVGATPVFADIETETFGIDPESVKKVITEDTAAIIPVHVYGAPCRIHELAEIAESNDLWLIEDAAESFGAKAKSEYTGTIGDIGALSFCQNKILPTGEGGAIITDNSELAKKAAQYSNHGRIEGDYFGSVGSGEYERVGSNYRMSDMVAALGYAQLQKVDELIASRQRVAEQYREGISSINGITPHQSLSGDDHVYQLFTILLDDEEARSNVIDKLTDSNISCKIYWDQPVHKNSVFAGNEQIKLPRTKEVTSRVLSLPMFPTLSGTDIDHILDVLSKLNL